MLFGCVQWACQKDSAGSADTPDLSGVELTYISAPNGMGDQGYYDHVYRGVCVAVERHGDVRLLSYAPSSVEEASTLVARWYAEASASTAARRLLILGCAQYAPLLDTTVALANSDILLLGAKSAPGGVYCRSVSLYGASFLAAQVLFSGGATLSPCVVLSNPYDALLNEGAQGFVDGAAFCGFRDSVPFFYLSQSPDGGYYAIDSMYNLCHTLSAQYSVLYPLVDGSVKGLNAFLNESPLGFYTCAVERDVRDFDRHTIVGYNRRMDMVVSDFFESWYFHRRQARQEAYLLSSQYITISNAKDNPQFSLTDEMYLSAIEAEETHTHSGQEILR